VDGNVDCASAQRGINLGREEFLAIDLGQRHVKDAIAAGVDADEFDGQSRVRALQGARHRHALCPRQQ
jgi:hypothetical protein